MFSLAALIEFAQLLGFSFRISFSTALAMIIPFYLNLYVHWLSWDLFILIYLLLASSILFVFGFSRLDFAKSAGLIFGGIYVPVLASTLFLVRDMENGFILALSVLLLTWGTDSGAYFVGRLLGRRKLAPAISPNKSWAGAWGGLFTGMIIAIAIGIIMEADLFIFSLWGCAASVAGQIGDLCESAFKRYAGVKDSGTMLPGHGGFLDRIDSLLFTGAISYIFFGLMM